MITIPLYWQFVVLFVTHFVGDFVLQTHWQASNKSKDNEALGRHVASYTAVLGVTALVMLPLMQALAFTVLNGVMHAFTDYYTSRWSSKHFGRAMQDTFELRDATRNYGENADLWIKEHGWKLNPGRHFHNFFVIIGFDQLIHYATLAATLWLFAGAR